MSGIFMGWPEDIAMKGRIIGIPQVCKEEESGQEVTKRKKLILSSIANLNSYIDWGVTGFLGFSDSEKIPHYEDSQEGLIRHLAHMDMRVDRKISEFHSLNVQGATELFFDVDAKYRKASHYLHELYKLHVLRD